VACEVDVGRHRCQKTKSTLGIFKEISRLPDALHRLSSTLQAVAESQREHAPSLERLDELERTQAIWEAEMDARMMKADSKYKAAANAESRTRKQLEKLDPFDDQSDEVQEGIPPEYALASEAEGMLDVRMDVAPLNSKVLATRMKFL